MISNVICNVYTSRKPLLSLKDGVLEIIGIFGCGVFHFCMCLKASSETLENFDNVICPQYSDHCLGRSSLEGAFCFQ